MRLVRAMHEQQPIPAIRTDSGIVPLQREDTEPVRFGSVLEQLCEQGPDAVQRVAEQVDSDPIPYSEVDLAPPVPSNGRVFALGGVYTDHLRERGQELAGVPSQWYLPDSAVIGSEEPIILPERTVENVMPAVELGVVIGRSGRHIAEPDVMDHVAGYTVVNDVTARTKWPGLMAYKLLDTFSPTGPHIQSADSVAQLTDLELRLTQDGEEICRGSTAGMRFSIPFLVSFMSSIVTLRPGDVIATGDPGDVDRTLRPGSKITATIETVGALSNPVETDVSR